MDATVLNSPAAPSSGTPLGWWTPDSDSAPEEPSLKEALYRIDAPLFMVDADGETRPRLGGQASLGKGTPDQEAFPLLGCALPCRLEELGAPDFCRDHGIRYPFVAGSMAKGIASADLVEAAAKAGMLGFFGAAGLPLDKVEATIDRLFASLPDRPFGFNLIHSPNEPELESSLVELYLRRGVRLIEASAFLALTLPVVRFRVAGIHRDAGGKIVTPNQIIAKVSREEVAAHFLSPPPEKYLKELVALGEITTEQAELARQVPMAQDLTAEADSGGHTDNRPALALFPTICGLRDRMQAEHGYPQAPRIGLGGGIGTPAAAAAAFTMGAAYIMTGSINQSCIESGTSDEVRRMLAETRQADITMAPAADMFEMGVKVQVLKRGTMFSMRAAKLYDLYRSCASLEDIPPAEREKLEKTLFRQPLDTVWAQTRAYFLERDRRQAERADSDPKYRMALVFRWYLGMAAHWANDGDPTRKMDYQVWCGPAMGAFNEWVRGSSFEPPANRTFGLLALNILFGAAVQLRLNSLRSQGVALPNGAPTIEPLALNQIKEYLR